MSESAPAGKPHLKLPAYGKALLNARRLGEHPPVVHVIYGEEWGRGERCGEGCDGATHPRLAVKPSEFQPWTIDWRVVTGCLVAVFDSREDCFNGGKRFYEMVGEIGRFAGPVHIYRWQETGRAGGVSTTGYGLAFCASVVAAQVARANGAWPGWWPIETERLNGERRERWFRLTAARHEPVSTAA